MPKRLLIAAVAALAAIPVAVAHGAKVHANSIYTGPTDQIESGRDFIFPARLSVYTNGDRLIDHVHADWGCGNRNVTRTFFSDQPPPAPVDVRRNGRFSLTFRGRWFTIAGPKAREGRATLHLKGRFLPRRHRFGHGTFSIRDGKCRTGRRKVVFTEREKR
jgi:hypothetical protein